MAPEDKKKVDFIETKISRLNELALKELHKKEPWMEEKLISDFTQVWSSKHDQDKYKAIFCLISKVLFRDHSKLELQSLVKLNNLFKIIINDFPTRFNEACYLKCGESLLNIYKTSPKYEIVQNIVIAELCLYSVQRCLRLSKVPSACILRQLESCSSNLRLTSKSTLLNICECLINFKQKDSKSFRDILKSLLLALPELLQLLLLFTTANSTIENCLAEIATNDANFGEILSECQKNLGINI